MQFNPTVATHAPFWQALAEEQMLPSSQFVPFARFAFLQPVTGSQLSLVQALLSPHASGVPVHAPFEHLSAAVQAFPSLQAFALFVCWQPAVGEQLSSVQGFPSSHPRATAALHVPAWQVSFPLQRFASAQLVPFATGGWVHAPPEQES